MREKRHFKHKNENAILVLDKKQQCVPKRVPNQIEYQTGNRSSENTNRAGKNTNYCVAVWTAVSVFDIEAEYTRSAHGRHLPEQAVLAIQVVPSRMLLKVCLTIVAARRQLFKQLGPTDIEIWFARAASATPGFSHVLLLVMPQPCGLALLAGMVCGSGIPLSSSYPNRKKIAELSGSPAFYSRSFFE